MSWEIKKLSDCCVSIADGDHQAPPKADSGIPFVTISNINSANQFDFTDTMFVPQEYYDRYLKCFEYDSLGNTSAISKAVNSKIIKGMPFVMPDNATITQFHKIAKPIFDAIKDKQSMNMKLAEARDRLLPKLMNGEIEV